MAHRNGNGSSVLTSVEVEEVNGQFAEWRRTRQKSARIPDELWAMAAGLATRYGINKTAKALHLGYKELKRRVQPQRPARETAVGGNFLEWLVPGAPALSECSIEVKSSQGAQLLVHVRNLDALGLGRIIREFTR